ncbi:uncharacterized protein LOC122245379 [Penaeus japonicus]|uniref:uncharacterized protein LOC122245379 n=1 Tax=Penaeus japonicus TaxID=27405 RepID=UPI001C716BBE|nr:uncharacterized protein LOC122245379 [Penaeus japonicus]
MVGHGIAFEKLYQRLFEGQSLTVTGDAYQYKNLSKVRCGSACSMYPGCVSWAWEPSSWACNVFYFLTPTKTRTPALASTQTFGFIDGHFFENFPSPVSMTWAAAKSACQSRGATLVVPAHDEQAKLLMQWVGYDYAWVGIWRQPSGLTWFDVFDNVMGSLYWASGEPEDPFEWGSYRVPSRGLVTTPTTARTYLPLCKVLP